MGKPLSASQVAVQSYWHHKGKRGEDVGTSVCYIRVDICLMLDDLLIEDADLVLGNLPIWIAVFWFDFDKV